MSETFRANPRDRDWYIGHPVHEGARQDIKNLISHFPEEKLTIATSADSVGLQIADTYLWILNRAMGGELPEDLARFAAACVHPSSVDGISIPAMVGRFMAFEKKLPQADEIAPELKKRLQATIDAHRQKVKGMNL